ncbi:MAG: translocation/assembly module TamB domain-containing protein [Candidatus Omnitrophota bacterium]
MWKKTRYFSVILVLLIVAGFFSFVYMLLRTTKGSELITRAGISYYLDSEDILIGDIEGDLSQGLIFNEVEIKNLKMLPQGSIIKVQKLSVSAQEYSLREVNFDIYNGRLQMPGSEPVIFYGSYKNALLDLTVYSKHVSMRDIFDLFVDNITLQNISGQVKDMDIKIQGSLYAPRLTGSLYVENLKRMGFLLQDSPVIFDITLNDIKNNIRLIGEVILKKGAISARQTKADLLESKIIFSGDPKQPSFNCAGKTVIENVAIEILFKGTANDPELILSSTPPLSRGMLLAMLVTGKRWQGAEDTISQGQISPDIIKDVVDYIIFTGSGKTLTRYFRLENISFTLDSDKRGVAVTKGVSKKTEVSYGIKQANVADEQNLKTTHSVGVGYNINADESVSVEAEREIKPLEQTDEQQKQQADEKLMIKFKKQF